MIFGIDTSGVANKGTTINWAQVRAAGASFAFHRSNYGDQTDSTFKKNWAAMLDVGLTRGAYIFLRHPFKGKPAPSVAQQIGSMDATLSDAGGSSDFDFPPALDVEFPGDGRKDTGLTAKQLLDRVVEAAEHMRDEFGTLTLYTSARVIRDDLTSLPFPGWMMDLPLWLARYPFKAGPYVMDASAFKDGKNDPPTPVGWPDTAWDFHQYQGDATGFPGCGGSPVDMNRFASIAFGDSGGRVSWIQRKLSLTRIDGKFGPGVRQAVVEFQSEIGLVADGVVGPRTFAALCWRNI